MIRVSGLRVQGSGSKVSEFGFSGIGFWAVRFRVEKSTFPGARREGLGRLRERDGERV